MHDLIRKKRLEIWKLFKQFEEKNIHLVVTPQRNKSEETMEELKKKRKMAWRGFVTYHDFFSILKQFEFTKFTEE